jgi:BASS family bile acid:Na+ symporter
MPPIPRGSKDSVRASKPSSFRRAGAVPIAHAPTALQRLEAWTKKHSLELVLCAAAIAYVAPSWGVAVRRTKLGHVPFTGWSYDALTLALSLIMLSASVQCQPRDFAAVARSRAKLPFAASVYLVGPILALVAGMLALACLGDAVAQPLSLGLVLIGLMPIAMTSAAWVRMNGGSVPLLLGAIVATNTLAVPLVPLLLRRIASAGHAQIGAAIHAGQVIQQLTMAILVPVVIGMSLRTFAPKAVERGRPVLSLASTAGLLVSLGSTVSASRPHIEAHMGAIANAAAFTVALNVALYVVAVRFLRVLELEQDEAVTLLFGSGMRNMGAAMVIAAVAFPDAPLVALPAAVFSVSQQLLGGAMTSLLAARPELVDTRARSRQAARRSLGTLPSTPPPPA